MKFCATDMPAVSEVVTTPVLGLETLSCSGGRLAGRRRVVMFSRERRTPLAEWWWTVDRELLAAFLLLLGCGVGLSLAASPAVAEAHNWGTWHFFIRHIFFAAGAACVLIGVSVLPQRAVRLLALVTLLVSIVLLFATLKFGDEVKGARRWISVSFLSVQPSELIKPGFAVIASWLFAETMLHRDVPGRLIATGLLGLIVVPLVLQPDIGQTALMILTWSVLLFLSGISWWVIVALGVHGDGWRVCGLSVLPACDRAHRRLSEPGRWRRQLSGRKGAGLAAGRRLVRARSGRGDHQALSAGRPCRLCVLGGSRRVRHHLLHSAGRADRLHRPARARWRAEPEQSLRAAGRGNARHPVRHAVGDQSGGEPQSDAAQGHDLALRFLWRHLDDCDCLRHGHDAGADAQASPRNGWPRACRPIAARLPQEA